MESHARLEDILLDTCELSLYIDLDLVCSTAQQTETNYPLTSYKKAYSIWSTTSVDSAFCLASTS
jgi:hypothetical protein